MYNSWGRDNEISRAWDSLELLVIPCDFLESPFATFSYISPLKKHKNIKPCFRVFMLSWVKNLNPKVLHSIGGGLRGKKKVL